MNQPLISVVITAYNYGRFIEEAIDSVLSQDYPSDHIEVVVADDGSTDDTAERVKHYDSRVKYVYQNNCGQASALNLGFANARGEIVSLLDGDDFFLPGKLAMVADAFQRNPAAAMVYHPMQAWNMHTGEREMTQYPLVSASLFQNPEKFYTYVGPGTCASYQRKFLDRLLPIPEDIRMLADAYPGTLVVFVGPIFALPQCLSVYRTHGSNSYQLVQSTVPKAARDKRLRQWQVLVECMHKWLKENSYTKNQMPVRYVTDGWDYFLKSEQFALEAPGRLRYLRFVALENRLNRPLENWKLTAYNYLTLSFALLLGYEKRQQMYEWRGRMLAFFQSLSRKLIRR